MDVGKFTTTCGMPATMGSHSNDGFSGSDDE